MISLLRSANMEYPDISREDGYILDIKCECPGLWLVTQPASWPLIGHPASQLTSDWPELLLFLLTWARQSNINVAVTPRAKIRFWRNLEWNNIHLGDDVFLECEVQANPAVYNVTWRHNVSVWDVVDILQKFDSEENYIIHDIMTRDFPNFSQ